MKNKLAAAPMKEGDDFQTFLAARKGSGDVIAEGGASTRETSFSDVQLAKSWSAADDAALVAAIKTHPRGGGDADEAARWRAISAELPGRAAAECVSRLSALKDKLKAGSK